LKAGGERVRRLHLRRYTDIPALIYLLKEQRITLLDPQSWDDKNDSYFLGLYQKKKNLKTVLALCFSQAGETYHHWRVFAHGSSGVCISFKRTQLIGAIKKQSDLRMGPVEYLRLKEISNRKLTTEELPFLKRYPFKGENEFRVIYESKETELPTLDIAIPLDCIDKVTLSPWLASALFDHVKSMLRALPGCKAIKIRRSTLISNEQWKNLGASTPKAPSRR
jgi:hypothetical protein